MFITFEGIEGAGKTTQITALKDALTKQGKQVVVTREPGGTAFGVTIREMLLNPNTSFAHNDTELLLFFADRYEHVATVVKPALAQNKVVICDRFIDSTTAYQVGGRGRSQQFCDALSAPVNLTPDITFLLDLPVEEGLGRAKKRAQLDRFEKEEVAFHQRIRDSFLAIAKQEPNRVFIVDALQPQDTISKAIAASVQQWHNN